MKHSQQETSKGLVRQGRAAGKEVKRNRRRKTASFSASPEDAEALADVSPVFDSVPRCPREEFVRTCAYFKAEQRGFVPGLELDDWLAAETEFDDMLEQSAKDMP